MKYSRMDKYRLPKQAPQYKPKGRRNAGRPRKRWRDQLHLEDQGTGNTPKASWTWWWWWWWWWLFFHYLPVRAIYLNGTRKWHCILLLYFKTHSVSDYITWNGSVVSGFEQTDLILIEVLSCCLFEAFKGKRQECDIPYIQSDTQKTGTFEKPNKNWRNPRKKICWQKLNHYNLPFKRQ